LPKQIRRNQNIIINFNEIKKGSSCEGVASLFLNILKICRSAITEIYDDATQTGIQSFTVFLKNGDIGPRLMHSDMGRDDIGYQGPRLIFNDMGYQVVAILPQPGGAVFGTWKFIKRPDGFKKLPMALMDCLDHCECIEEGHSPEGWPDGWGTALFGTPFKFGTPFNLTLTVVFKEGRAQNWRGTISNKHKIWKLVEKDLPSSSSSSTTKYEKVFL